METIKVYWEADVWLQFIYYVEEMEWAIEEALKTGLPVAANMAINEKGDHAGVSAGECAVRMAKAGAQIGGWNMLQWMWEWKRSD